MAVVEPAVEARRVVDRRFRAMASEGLVSFVGPEALADEAIATVRSLEARWSRFVPASEISVLNRAPGTPTPVSAETATLVSVAVSAWEATGGLSDPTVLGAVLGVGYTRSRDEIASHEGAAVLGAGPVSIPGCGGIVVDGDIVTFPAGVAFDPGGIGKGLAADLVAERAWSSGADDVVVSLGGDLRVRGGVGGGSRPVEVEDPFDRNRVLASLHLADGGVATSSVLSRRFPGGHDTIDPRTGRPSSSDVTAVTVAADTAAFAEALATAVVVAGVEEGLAMVDGWGAAALVVDSRRRLHMSSRLGALL